MNQRWWKVVIVLGFAVLAWGRLPSEAVQITGTLIGEKCAQKIKVVDCSLKNSWPLVIFTSDGTYYKVELNGVDRAALDKIFGMEVKAEGEIDRQVIKVSKIESLAPVKSKEFTKG